MAIQNRRGDKSDLVKSNLLPGEYAICTDGTIVICYGGGLTKELASLADLEKLRKEIPDIPMQREISTEDQAKGGIDDTTIMTPAKVKMAVEQFGSALKAISVIEPPANPDKNTIYLIQEGA